MAYRSHQTRRGLVLQTVIQHTIGTALVVQLSQETRSPNCWSFPRRTQTRSYLVDSSRLRANRSSCLLSLHDDGTMVEDLCSA